MTTNIASPVRGEVWLVNFDPTIGAEIRKVRPAVVLSSDTIGRLPIKLIGPITDWKPSFANNIWHVKVEVDSSNGLAKTSAVDALQLRGVDKRRFIRKLGQLSQATVEEITIAVAAVIEY